MRRVKHFAIDKHALAECAPTCLLLLSLVKIDDYVDMPINPDLPVNPDLATRSSDEFGLLVSSNILLIP
jgi:hypothetical protein